MVYNGTDNIEIIRVNPMDNLSETHYISLTKSADSPTFYVTSCCDEEWGYEFYLENNSDYERIKFNIMEAIFDSVTMEELLDTLSEVFEEGFKNIMVESCDCGGCETYCDYDCENCVTRCEE